VKPFIAVIAVLLFHVAFISGAAGLHFNGNAPSGYVTVVASSLVAAFAYYRVTALWMVNWYNRLTFGVVLTLASLLLGVGVVVNVYGS